MALWQVVLFAVLGIGLQQATAAAEEEAPFELQACLGGLSEDEAEALFDDLSARYDVLAAEHDLDARLEAACTAGDRDGAEALWATFEAALYDGPDEKRMQKCLEAMVKATRANLAALGMAIDENPHVCDAEF